MSYYSVYKLKRLPAWTAYLYLLCFVVHRYQRLHDHLITSLMSHVRQYTEDAKAVAKDRVYTARIESNDTLHKAGHVLHLFTDDRIADETPFQEVRAHAFQILARDQLAGMADASRRDHPLRRNRLSMGPCRDAGPPIQAAPASGAPGGRVCRAISPPSAAGSRAVSHHGVSEREAAESLPSGTVPRPLASRSPSNGISMAPIPMGHKHLRPDRYEFLVYRLLRDRLEAGDLFCRDSLRFRSFEDDLLDDQQWQEKDRLLAETGLPILMQPIQEHLADLEQQLEDRLAVVNQRIATGENTHVQITRRGRAGPLDPGVSQQPGAGEPSLL